MIFRFNSQVPNRFRIRSVERKPG